jgi:hypothetical protein
MKIIIRKVREANVIIPGCDGHLTGSSSIEAESRCYFPDTHLNEMLISGDLVANNPRVQRRNVQVLSIE